MFADWMTNYDLSITKEDIQKYEENKKNTLERGIK